MFMRHRQAKSKKKSREDMEKPISGVLLSRFRLRCGLISVALVFWWVVVMVHFSVEPRALILQKSLGRPLLSVQREEALPSGGNGRRQERVPVTEEVVAKHRPKSFKSNQERAEVTGGEGEIRVDAKGDGFITFAEPEKEDMAFVEQPDEVCRGRYIYVRKLDPCFNTDLLNNCHRLSPWQNLCSALANDGLGPKLDNTDGVFSESGWYRTSQFALEQIFHNRMKLYDCLTKDSSKAAAIFVPFYAGFEIAMNLWGANITVRDAAPKKLYSFLQSQPEWDRYNGHDHFMVGGRITWDFRRRTDDEKDWGNTLFFLPAGLNMTMLAIEASPWHSNDFGIPYPTYFHPSSDQSITEWQHRVRKMERRSLFSFVGAPRPGSTSIRGKIMDQCVQSKRCKLLNCNDDDNRICHHPHNLMRIFESSIFCLQPPGDSYTRRSIFDSMLAGCIPVFFHYFSAYSQYDWHLPSNHSSYSVMIDEESVKNDTVKIEEVLQRYTADQIKTMREVVIESIPGIVYADARAGSTLSTKDAFDIAVQVWLHT